MESGQSQFHDAYIDSRIVPPKIWNKLDYATKNALVYDGFKMPYRFRIIWSREFLDLTIIKGYYIVDTKVLDNYKVGDVSPMAGLKMFEL